MKKILKIVATLILAILLFQAGRTLWASGFFKKIEPHTDANYQVIRGMVGAEDITIDPETGLALVSSFDRRKKLAGEKVKGAIYSLDFQADPPVFTDLTAGFDQPDFSPHGISLYTDPMDGTKWLFVVNHRDSGQFIEIFQLTDSSLIHSETIENELFVSPNDVCGTGKREFYFTNDHGSRGGISHFKDFLMIGTGQVGYFDGNKVEILDTGILYANGINISKDGQYVLAASTTGRKINVYQRNPFKKLTEILCGTGVDNVELDGAGNLWVAAHPKLFDFLSHAKSAEERSPSQILKIKFTNSTAPAEVTEVYLNDGNPLSGSSGAAVFKNYLLMGTVFEDGVLMIKNE
jgi:arylesterase / paraoxonase